LLRKEPIAELCLRSLWVKQTSSNDSTEARGMLGVHSFRLTMFVIHNAMVMFTQKLAKVLRLFYWQMLGNPVVVAEATDKSLVLWSTGTSMQKHQIGFWYPVSPLNFRLGLLFSP
jgi:hypothetical protein